MARQARCRCLQIERTRGGTVQILGGTGRLRRQGRRHESIWLVPCLLYDSWPSHRDRLDTSAIGSCRVSVSQESAGAIGRCARSPGRKILKPPRVQLPLHLNMVGQLANSSASKFCYVTPEQRLREFCIRFGTRRSFPSQQRMSLASRFPLWVSRASASQAGAASVNLIWPLLIFSFGPTLW